MRAILASVEYSDLLALSLPYNRHHFDEVFVVTTPEDLATQAVAKQHGATLVITDLFHARGADFNKWAAMEHGINVMGRGGWMCIMDADVLWPKKIPRQQLTWGCIYTPCRRMCSTIPSEPPPEESWRRYPIDALRNHWSGYTQIFHADDPVLGHLPWFDDRWKHAGGADTVFQERWRSTTKRRPTFEVLHLGAHRQNWCGRVSPFADGTRPQQAETRQAAFTNYMKSRTGRGSHRFDHERS